MGSVAKRTGRIIEAADRRGLVVLVDCLYCGGSSGRKWIPAASSRSR